MEQFNKLRCRNQKHAQAIFRHWYWQNCSKKKLEKMSTDQYGQCRVCPSRSRFYHKFLGLWSIEETDLKFVFPVFSKFSLSVMAGMCFLLDFTWGIEWSYFMDRKRRGYELRIWNQDHGIPDRCLHLVPISYLIGSS